jgi:hypothetical protein
MLMLSLPTYAEEKNNLTEVELTMQCGPANTMLGNLKRKYSEIPFFAAPSLNEYDHNLVHSLLINSETKTWTFLVINKQADKLCIIASGDNAFSTLPDRI